MMAMLLTNCGSAWGIENQEELHDAALQWKTKLAESKPLMARHLEHLHLMCADIADLDDQACELIGQADVIFCNNLLFGSLETRYKRCSSFHI